MKRPSFQFYPADWRSNTNLRRCSLAARGAWIDVMCVLHDSDEYGVVRWPLSEIASVAGVPPDLLAELVAKHVLKGDNASAAEFTHTTRHAGKDGPTHVLIPASAGPCWFSSRMVVDEFRRNASGGETRFGSPDRQPCRRQGARQGETPDRQPCQRHGHGAPSPSPSPSPIIETNLPAVKPPGKPRSRNPVMDALASATGIDPAHIGTAMAKRLNSKITVIKESSPDVTPEEIQARAAAYRQKWPEMSLTPEALAKHWHTLSGASSDFDRAYAESQAAARQFQSVMPISTPVFSRP